MLLVGNGRLITNDLNNPYLTDGCVAIEDKCVHEIGPTADLKHKFSEAQFIDAQGKVIMPGLINTHMHLYSTFARGMALKDAQPANFMEILERLWWRLDKALTLQDVYYSALVSLIGCIKNGTTTIFDHHASPNAVQDSLFTIAKAAEQAGVRSCLCYEVSDRDGAVIMQEGIRENSRFISAVNQRSDEMLKGMFGLHASFTLSDQTLKRCIEASGALGAGFHIHTAEGKADQDDALKQYGKRIVQRLAGFGILGRKTIASHCVHVNDEEIRLLQETGTKVAHNPESNMGNAVGCAPVLQMMEQGVCVGLGTDGYTGDMFESYKTASVLHKHQTGHPGTGGVEVPAMLWQNNPEICQEHFQRPLGRLVPGAYADLIIVNYDPPTPMFAGNLYGHILFGMSGLAVDSVIINGKVVMQNRELPGLDEAEIYAKARELAGKVWERF